MRNAVIKWLCALLAVTVAVAAWILWGATLLTLVISAITLGCLFAMFYGWYLSRRALAALDEAPVHTHGVTMNYAAPVYDFYCPLLGLGTEFRRETLHHAALAPGEQVLDVGCGTGVLTRLAAQQVGVGGTVIGIDPSPAMLQVARRHASTEANRASFKVAAIEALPFEGAHFDVVLSSLMLHHLPPALKRAGLAEVYRVLKPGGRFVIVDVDRPAVRWLWLIVWPLLLMPMTASNLRGEIPGYLQDAGFSPVTARGRWMRWLSFWLAVKPVASL